MRSGRHPRSRWLLIIAICALGACREAGAPPGPAGEAAPAKRSTAAAAPRSQLAAAIDSAAHYLARQCDDQGRFQYRVHLDPAVALPPAYNELRHAGAVYALAQSQRRAPDPVIESAMLRSAAYLRHTCFGPVADQPALLAVWPVPETSDETAPREAKLGGAALALVALLTVEAVAPETTPCDELRALGRFLIFMQKPDGGFYSKYLAESGRSDAWQSEYYPGEAALGLALLYQHDTNPAWQRAATQALAYIAQRGMERPIPFPDQWYLLATAQVLDAPPDTGVQVPRDVLLRFAQRLCVAMFAEQEGQANLPPLAGCFTPDGRTCPTATRIEGLLAATRFLPGENPALAEPLRHAIDHGVQFLLASQITDGPLAGGFPRVEREFQAATPHEDGQRALEIRIDYVQHALSALIGYEALSAQGP